MFLNKDSVCPLECFKKINTFIYCRNYYVYYLYCKTTQLRSIFFVHIAYCPHPWEISCSFIKYFLNFLNKYSLKNSELSLQRVSEEIDKLMVSIKDFTDSILTLIEIFISKYHLPVHIFVFFFKRSQFAVHLLKKCDS